jgi:hypothetical protein
VGKVGRTRVPLYPSREACIAVVAVVYSPFRNTHAFVLLAPSLECARTRLLRCARESVPPTRLDGEYKAIQ